MVPPVVNTVRCLPVSFASAVQTLDQVTPPYMNLIQMSIGGNNLLPFRTLTLTVFLLAHHYRASM